MISRFRADMALLGCVAALFAVGLLVECLPASAETFGEIGQVGEFGIEEGQFTYPTDLAVDTENNDVYVLDEPGGEYPGIGPSHFRIQMFKPPLAAGEKPTATLEVKTPPDAEGHKRWVASIAVDSTLKRLYVLLATATSRSGYNEFAGMEIDAYATEPASMTKTLPPAPNVETNHEPGVFYKFPPMPATATPPPETLREPNSMAVDPATHDLVLSGRDETANTFIEQLNTAEPYSTATFGVAYDDSNGVLVAKEDGASGVAVGPEGKIYVSSHNLVAKGPTALPGIATLTGSLNSPVIALLVKNKGGESRPLTGGLTGESGTGPGAQIAVSPDGTTVYATEVSKEQSSEAGSYEIRGISTATGAQKVAFGGGTSTCLIASELNAIAAGSGEVVYALDEGSWTIGGSGHTVPSAYGFHLIEFGPGAKNKECPSPSAEFDINEHPSSPTTALSIKKGQTASFEAQEKLLNGEVPEEVQWEVSGPEKFTETSKRSPGAPAELKTPARKFLKIGKYTITLKIVLENNGAYGNPPPVIGELVVEPTPPIASFEVFPSAGLGAPLGAGQVKPAEEVTFNGAESYDPTGSPTGGRTNALKAYRWEFGDGKVVEKKKGEPEESTYTRSFSNPGVNARSETVKLTVENEEGIQSEASPLTFTIQGTPSSGNGNGNGNGSSPPPSTNPQGPTPPPIVKPLPLTKAQKLAKALHACKKDRSRRARTSCERQARSKYGPKSKKKRKRK